MRWIDETTDRFARELTYAADHDGVAYISPTIAKGTNRYATRLREALVDPGQSIEERELFDHLQQNAWDEEDLFREFGEIVDFELACAADAGGPDALAEALADTFGLIVWTDE